MADDGKGADDLQVRLNGLADELGLEGDERKSWLHDHLTKAGYEMIPSYVKKDGAGDGGKTGGKRGWGF